MLASIDPHQSSNVPTTPRVTRMFPIIYKLPLFFVVRPCVACLKGTRFRVCNHVRHIVFVFAAAPLYSPFVHPRFSGRVIGQTFYFELACGVILCFSSGCPSEAVKFPVSLSLSPFITFLDHILHLVAFGNLVHAP